MTEKLGAFRRLLDGIDGDVLPPNLIWDCFDASEDYSLVFDAYKGSLDATRDLQSRLLPEHSRWRITGGNGYATAVVGYAGPTDGLVFSSETGARAWLKCILWAKIIEMQGGEYYA